MKKYVTGLHLSQFLLLQLCLCLINTSCINPLKQTSNRVNSDKQILYIGDDIAIAKTEYGKIQGYQLNGIYTFLGIPYGANTTGENRFMPPQKPEPWKYVKPAVFYGNSAPQKMENRWPNDYSTFSDHWNYWDVSENCLALNVWTPSISDEKKRPVLVWLHGGGFTNGSGIEQDSYHGENISKYGDIVFCSVNHRLGSLGFSDFSGVGGEKYTQSGNVGMLDIIAALEWVHNNIKNFGGDPENVTIMGQSGGGSKVCTLTSMPAAKGLIHKAVALSGNTLDASDQEITKKIGEYILKEAQIIASQIDVLQKMPWREYLELADRAASKCIKETGVNTRRIFGPVADDINIPKGTFYSSKLQNTTPQVPMLFCSTFHEWNPDRGDASLENVTIEDVVTKLIPKYGDRSKEIVTAYSKNFPGLRPIEIWALILSNRKNVVATANAKLQQQQPVYMAWFGWEPPLFNNRMRAFHCLDISFWFKNTDKMVTQTGGGKVPRQLSDKMADALLNFMRTGDPNGGKLPKWPKYTEAKGEVMILNNDPEVVNDPDKEARKSLE